MIRGHYESCCVCLSVMVFGNHYGSCCTNRGRSQFSIKEADIAAVWIVLFSGPWFILLSLPTCPFQSFYATSVFLLYAIFLFISLVSNNQYSLFWSLLYSRIPELLNLSNSLYLELLSRCLRTISQNLKIRTYLDNS